MGRCAHPLTSSLDSSPPLSLLPLTTAKPHHILLVLSKSSCGAHVPLPAPLNPCWSVNSHPDLWKSKSDHMTILFLSPVGNPCSLPGLTGPSVPELAPGCFSDFILLSFL